MKRFGSLASTASAALLVLAFAVAASAQVMTISGKVTLKQADGTEVPVKDAEIEIHRLDIKQKFTAKTDRNGRYVNVGIPIAGTYTLIVSAPGAAPTFLHNVKLSQKTENDFVLSPGDGSKLTLDQVKTAAAGGGGGSGTNASPSAGDTAEAKKKAAELAAEREKIAAENQRAAELNAKLPEILKAGNEAFNAKRFDEAVARYDEGIAADPEQSVFHRNKAVALRARAIDKFNTALRAKDQAGKDAARADFKASTESAEKAVSAYREFTSKRQTGGATGAPNEELNYLEIRAESYRLALQTSTPVDNDAAVKAIEEYVNAESDPAKKNKMQASLGDALVAANKVPEAVAKFREILAANPSNVDAMYGLGIALASLEQPQLAEAVASLEQFVSKAPDTHPNKQTAQQMVEELKGSIKELSNKPQDTKSSGRTTRRRP